MSDYTDPTRSTCEGWCCNDLVVSRNGRPVERRQEAQTMSDERLRRGVSENGCVVWSAPDSPVGSEPRECEAYANPLDGGWGGYRAECHACEWIANRRDEKGVAQADALHRATQTCPWRQGTGHERVTDWSAWLAECRELARQENARRERVIPATDLRKLHDHAAYTRSLAGVCGNHGSCHSHPCIHSSLDALVAKLDEFPAEAPSGGTE